VQPCRPNGPALNCCVFHLTEDPREFYPKDANCDEIQETAKNLFVIEEEGCHFEDGKWNNNMCLPPNNATTTDNFAEDYSLWSHYAASGPFANKDGDPIRIQQKCGKISICM